MVENLDGEVWTDIVGLEGLYQVSNKGRAKCLERVVGNNHRKIEEHLMPHYKNKGSAYEAYIEKFKKEVDYELQRRGWTIKRDRAEIH